MPKPRNDTWQTCPNPQTPLQRGAFLDLCTDWLVRQPSDPTDDALEGNALSYEGPSASASASIGHTQVDLRVCDSRRCDICEAETDDLHTVLANPFAQLYLVVVCGKCHAL